VESGARLLSATSPPPAIALPPTIAPPPAIALTPAMAARLGRSPSDGSGRGGSELLEWLALA
jgi:hypothetical protein